MQFDSGRMLKIFDFLHKQFCQNSSGFIGTLNS